MHGLKISDMFVFSHAFFLHVRGFCRSCNTSIVTEIEKNTAYVGSLVTMLVCTSVDTIYRIARLLSRELSPQTPSLHPFLQTFPIFQTLA